MEHGRGEGFDPDLAAAAQESGLTMKIEGAAGLVQLHRPRALNALTTAMRAEIAAAFAGWARNPQVYAVVVESLVEQAFCAGGDLREMFELGQTRLDEALRSVAAEYALNWQLECFTKPTVSLINGLVVGSGVGISLYGTHRVAGERYSFAMPEVRVGLFPDDGVSWTLAKMPDHIGMYLALTGRALARADAYRLGLATHCIAAARFPEIKAALSEANPVDPLLDEHHEDPGPGELDAIQAVIARCFGKESVEAIVAALEAEGVPHEAWIRGVLEDLRRGSPTSLKVTYRHVRLARTLDLSATLKQDYRLAARCMRGRDFYEGVRAALLDRDHAPKWQPATLAEVTGSAVEAYFASLAENELALFTRAEMQAIRS